ncbi:MAG TPA: MSMEG_1061 family FMN-dependent PPOX-type flavoprotein [Trebonia sp.]
MTATPTAITEITEITSETELREALGGDPSTRAATKDRPSLHPLQVQWLQASPFCVLATSDSAGRCDASPKGDPAGHLIHVLDPRTVVIAERPGNKRADGYLNVLSNPHVGLIALIPGRDDTLRINGRARIVRDAPWFGELAVQGKRPILALLIEIEQVFSHCPKAFMRSSLWEPSAWPATQDMPSVAALTKAVQNPAETLPELEAHYAGPHYTDLLY